MRDGEATRPEPLTFYVTAVVIVLLDQLTKLLARAYLAVDRPFTVISGFFDLRLSYNTGAAFGILPDWAPLFIIAALVAIYAAFRMGRAEETSRAFLVGLGMLLGGSLGNLIDRLTNPMMGVTDFLSFHLRVGGQTYVWPTFNIADIGIVLGAILVLYHVFLIEKRRNPHEPADEQ